MDHIKVVFVDFDGTLVNSEFANARAYCEALKEHGYDFDVTNLTKQISGRHWSQFIPELVGNSYSPDMGLIVAERKREIYRSYYLDIRINEGVVQLLYTLPVNVAKVLVSSASRKPVTEILSLHNLAKLFQMTVCSEDVNCKKPDPEPYAFAMKKLCVSPEDCLALEDSDAGVESARSAGIKVLRVLF